MTSGSAIIPGSEQPSHDPAHACMNALERQPSDSTPDMRELA
jgi:hypothetical protein